jgi:hypothetical protein
VLYGPTFAVLVTELIRGRRDGRIGRHMALAAGYVVLGAMIVLVTGIGFGMSVNAKKGEAFIGISMMLLALLGTSGFIGVCFGFWRGKGW